MLRFPLAITLSLLLPGFAAAAEPAQTAFDLLAKQAGVSAQSDFIKLDEQLDMETAKAIDTELSALYGAPETSRAGLKVWSVSNPSATSTQAEVTTIMCGPDGKGGLHISADRRGAVSNRLQTPKPIVKKRKTLPVTANARARQATGRISQAD
jgi:hypothetical protein